MVSPALKEYVNKMKGQRFPTKYEAMSKPPTRFVVLLSSFIGSFVGIAIIAALTYNASFFVERDTPVITGSFGASAVLIYGAIESPLSQPRNVIGGHMMSSLVAVSLYKLFNLLSPEMFLKLHWLLCSLAVSVSLLLMQLTHTVHPPASATALIAVTGGETIYNLGYWYVLCPIGLGVALMFAVAMIVNNVGRRYPLHWWSPKQKMIRVVDQDQSKSIATFISREEEEDEDDRTSRDDATAGQTPVSTRSSITDPQLTLHAHNFLRPPPNTHKASHTHHDPQIAIYYGGERDDELKNGEIFQDQSSTTSNNLEHGHGDRHHSICIGTLGSASLSRSTEEDYHLTIQQLRHRIQELESQLAAPSKEL